jgi:uncharacterized protein (TIGR02246 family)
MKLYSWVSTWVLMLAIAACALTSNQPQTPAKPTVEGDTKAINKLRDEFVTAWKAGDGDRVAKLYSNDAVVLPQNQAPVNGRSAIASFNKNSFDQFVPNNFELSSEELQIMSDWAFDRGTYKFMITPKAGGEPINDQGKYIVILQRQADGSWKVARDIDNSSNPRPQLAQSQKPKS